jgi:hypothetical protein
MGKKTYKNHQDQYVRYDCMATLGLIDLLQAAWGEGMKASIQMVK